MIYVSVTGGGGAAGAGYGSSGSNDVVNNNAGSAGAIVTCTVPASPNQSFTIYVGGQGSSGGNGGWGYSTGGAGLTVTNGGYNALGGAGGGSSAILSGSTVYVVAGGGGGGGSVVVSYGNYADCGAGGAGGTPNGANGVPGSGGTGGGGGATQSAVGAGGTASGWQANINGNSGSSGTGGAGTGYSAAAGATASGGGGAGYYGGGSGAVGLSGSVGNGGAGAGGGGGGSSWVGNGAGTPTYSTASSPANGTVTITWYSAPNAPTLSGPSKVTAGNSATLTGTYNSTDGENQNAYALEWYTNGTLTGYWNGSSFQSTITWLSDNVAPNGQWSVTIPASLMSGGNTYSWSMASQEAGANLQGPFASTQSFTVQNAYSAPSAPTLLTPANGSYNDVSHGLNFQATYNSNDGYSQNYFSYRIKTSSGSYEYWNGTGLQSSQVWVAETVAPGGTISMTLPASSFFTNGATYNWSMASQESGGNLQGPFAADFTLNAQAAPTMSFIAPSGTVNVSYPEISWVTTPAPGANQIAYRIVVCPGAAQSSPPTPYTWDSGWVTSSAQNVSVGVALSNNTQYTAYGMVQETGGEYSSSWATTTWTEVFTSPSTPLVSVVAGADAAANNMPAMLITVQGQDNYMGEPDSDFETGLGNWGYVTEDGAWVSGGHVNGSDSSGNKQDLILANKEVSVTSPVGSAFAQALSFSSNQGLASGPTGNTYEQGAITSAWTVEFRYQPSAADVAATSAVLVWRGTSSLTEWSCYLASGKLTFSWETTSGSSSFAYSTALTAGTTYTVAVVLSSGTFTMYVNGSSVGTASAGTLATPSSSSSLSLGLLSISNPGFTGIIDELRISNTARYTANYTPATSEFTADSNTGCLYHFDGGLQQSSTPTCNPLAYGDLETVTFPTQTAQYIKVTLEASESPYWWSIAEFNAYLNGNALNRSAWTGSSNTSGGSPANAFDGNLSTWFDTGASQAAGDYFEVNMGTPQTFNEITMNSSTRTNDYARGYIVQVSNDGNTWTQVGPGGNYPSMAIVCAASAVTAQWGNAYIQGGNTYTFLSDLQAAQSGSATITPNLLWFTSTGTLISTSAGSAVTPINGGWTVGALTATAPSNAAYCQVQLTISGAAAGQTFYVAAAGIFPNWGTTPTWNAGGMVGTEGLIILRNDGDYVRWAALGDPYPMNSVSQEITIYDHEATSNTQYTYSAQLHTTYNNTTSAAGYSNAATLNFTGAWEADPTNLAATGGYVNSNGLAAANAQVTKWNPVQLEQSASHLVLNQTVPNVVANAMGAPGFSCEFQTFAQSVYQALQAVLTSQKTIFVTMAYGASYYVRFGPSPTGMASTGMGSQVINSQLQPSTAAGPYYIVTTQAVPQIRPAP